MNEFGDALIHFSCTNDHLFQCNVIL